MIPKEKAKELIEKFKPNALANWENYNLKQCALIAVDEILNNSVNVIDCAEDIISDEEYWQQVKEEITKL